MRLRTSLSAVLCVGIGLAGAGCDEVSGVFAGVRGSGNVITAERNVSNFDEIVVLVSGNVFVSVTGSESLMIEAEDNIMPLLTAAVRNGRLELGSESSFSATRGITYAITVVALERVEINGSGDVTVTGIDGESFAAEINGSGNGRASGVGVGLEVGINGSGNFSGDDLTTANGIVEISGSGSAVVNVTDDLNASVSGSGDIEYLGDPALDASVSGSGRIASGVSHK